MRSAILLLAAACVLSAPAAAETVRPQALALRPVDVAPGFRFDRSESGIRTNALEAKENPELGRLFPRWHRLTGYRAVFERGDEIAVINSRADLFRSSDGSRSMLRWADGEAARSTTTGLRRSSISIGEGGWVYSAEDVTVVLWRFGRVFAALSGEGVSRARTLALARVQLRRIAAALG